MPNKIPFDYLGARKAGHTDEDIQKFLKEKYAFDFDITGARNSGYDDKEIADYITAYEAPVKKKEFSDATTLLEKALQPSSKESVSDPLYTSPQPKSQYELETEKQRSNINSFEGAVKGETIYNIRRDKNNNIVKEGWETVDFASPKDDERNVIADNQWKVGDIVKDRSKSNSPTGYRQLQNIDGKYVWAHVEKPKLDEKVLPNFSVRATKTKPDEATIKAHLDDEKNAPVKEFVESVDYADNPKQVSEYLVQNKNVSDKLNELIKERPDQMKTQDGKFNIFQEAIAKTYKMDEPVFDTSKRPNVHQIQFTDNLAALDKLRPQFNRITSLVGKNGSKGEIESLRDRINALKENSPERKKLIEEFNGKVTEMKSLQDEVAPVSGYFSRPDVAEVMNLLAIQDKGQTELHTAMSLFPKYRDRVNETEERKSAEHDNISILRSLTRGTLNVLAGTAYAAAQANPLLGVIGADNKLDEAYDSYKMWAQAELSTPNRSGGGWNDFMNVLDGVAETVPQMIATAKLSKASRVLESLPIGLPAYAEGYNSAITEGMSKEGASLYGLTNMAIQMGSERLFNDAALLQGFKPSKKLIELGIRDKLGDLYKNELAKEASEYSGKLFGGKLLKDFGKQITEEYAANYAVPIQNRVFNYFAGTDFNEDFPTLKENLQTAASIGLITTGMRAAVRKNDKASIKEHGDQLLKHAAAGDFAFTNSVFESLKADKDFDFKQIEPLQKEIQAMAVQDKSHEEPTVVTPEGLASPIEKSNEDKITVGEMLDKKGTYNGQRGIFYQDGQSVVFKVEGKPKEYELGNVNEVKDKPIDEFGIKHEDSVVSIDNGGNFDIRGEKYSNPFEERGQSSLDAITYDKDGNIVNVRMKTPEGERRTFKGDVAEDLAYQIHLKEINKNNETRTAFEQHLNEDPAAQKEMDDAGFPEVTTPAADKSNETVSREKIELKYTVENFVDRIAAGEKMTSPEDLQFYDNNKTEIEKLLKQKANENHEQSIEADKQIPSEEKSGAVAEPIENKPEAETGEGEPPIPPPKNKPTLEGEKTEGNKSLAVRLVNAKNVPEAAKEGIRSKGLTYEPQNQQEAQDYAKAIIDEVGMDEAVLNAQAQKFGGDVNTLVQTESLNRLAELSDKETDPAKKLEYDKKFAQYSIELDEWLRKQGRGISAVNFFYKKSPLGIQLIENTKRKQDFDNWSKPKDKSWKEFFDEMMKEPEFESIIKEEVKEGMKKERAESRKARIKKVDDFIDKAKDQFKGGAAYSTIIPSKVITAALEGIKKAYHAGESVLKMVQDAIDYISKELGHDNWDKEKFRAEWEEKLKDAVSAEELYKQRLKKQIAELDQQIANRKRNPPKPKEQKEHDEETKKLIEERDKKKAILDEIVAPQDRLERYKKGLSRQIEDLQKQIDEKKRKKPSEKAEPDEAAKALSEKRDELKKELERVAPLKKTDEYRVRQLNKFRKKLKGLTEEQKDEVIRKAHKQLIENGALDYEDFRKIISRVTGRGELTPEEATRMKELVKKTNAVEEAAVKVRTERTQESLKELDKAEIEAGAAAKELNELFHNKPDIVRRLTSIMQLSTLGIPALVNNPIYNIWNQMALRFPIGVVNDSIDRAMGMAGKMSGRTVDQEYNVWQTQREFWSKLGLGTKEALSQFGTGLTRQDYFDKEIVTQQQIRPFKSLRDIGDYFKGKKPLTRKQFWDKLIQGTSGIPAEVVARTLNLGDKPQRFAAEGAQGSAFAKILGLKNIDYDIFIKFPREEAFRHYKSQGLGDEVAGQKADAIYEAIKKEGQRSTFQQDNLLNDAITKAVSVLGGKDSGAAQLTKALVISPYIKIPSNAFWSFFNLLNPEIAILQAGVHALNAKRLSNKSEATKAHLQNREARYWLAHAIVGIGWRAAIIALVKAGTFVPGSDDDDSKKERDANAFFDKPGYVNIGDVKISNRWFGFIGMMGNSVAKKWKDATPEQREAMDDFWNIVFGGMEFDALDELENGVFSNSSSLLQSLSTGDWSRYGMNTINMMTNIIQPAAIAQINRAALDEVPSSKGDSFLDKLNQNFAQRSTLYRKAFNVQVEKKRDIWGQPIPKGGNILSRMFGISKANPQLFGRPVYEDYLRTNDSGFLPPAVLPTLNGQKLNTKQEIKLQEYIGGERYKLVAPYINDMAETPITKKKYSESNDEKKKEVLQYLYTRGREKGLEMFYKDYPEFRPKGKTIQDKIDDSIWGAEKQIMKIKEPKE